MHQYEIIEVLKSYSALLSVIVIRVQDLKLRRWRFVGFDVSLGCACAVAVYVTRDRTVHGMESTEEEAVWVSEKLDVFIRWLQTLVEWLMGNPAGLKLNRPLNQTLGHFFLYHIYLWRTYITFLAPVLKSVFFLFRWVGILGLGFQIALLVDLMGLLTVHVYCFHIYAARLYQLHSVALLSLWRLFRGKKKNPLRNRIDSLEFDPQQLLLGCLLFTVLLFLLPTILVYYVVFAVLRFILLNSGWILMRIPHLTRQTLVPGVKEKEA